MSGTRIRFRLLGPFEVEIDGDVVDVGRPRQQAVLAALAIVPYRTVVIERLITTVYGADPPPTAKAQVQICVSALRRLFAGHGQESMITTRPGGYALRAADDDVDLRRFEALVAEGRARRGDAPEAAVTAYRSALALWRGPALGGLDSEAMRAVAHRLDEQRLAVIEECIDLELGLGRHRDVLIELTTLAAEHPVREQLQGQLMLALHHAGRPADALEVYHRTRRVLVDELGIEPGPRLRRLQRAVLAGRTSLDIPPPKPGGDVTHGTPPEAAVPTPRLLPTDIADFTGRDAEIDAAGSALTGAPDPGVVPIVVVSGRPGVGKTALAVHLGHRVADRYPDGQLFADLRGPSGRPADPAEILGRFLRVLGVPGMALPEGTDARAELYRHRLAGRRMLVVLDNAGDERQILSLLPGTPPSAVLVTGRQRFGGLPATAYVEVGLFEPRTAMDLLSRMVGAERVAAEPEAAATLADLCGHLPLALRIAGARLVGRPHWTVEHLVTRLLDQGRRLAELQYGPWGVRAGLALSYEGLSGDARRLLRRLAVADFGHIRSWMAAALLESDHAGASDLLDELADARLLDPDAGGRRYRLHDLVRVYAGERLRAEEPGPEQAAALARVLGGLLFLAERANRPHAEGDITISAGVAARWALPDEVTARLLASPRTWLDEERHTLTTGIRLAAEANHTALSWELAYAASWVFEEQADVEEWRMAVEVALGRAEAAGDPQGQATMLYCLGSAHLFQQRYDAARRPLERAAALFRHSGDEQSRALPLRNLAYLDRLRGDLDAAAARYTEALALLRRGPYPVGVAYVLHGLARISLERGNGEAALRMLEEALTLSRQGGTRRVEAQVHCRLGELWLSLGTWDRAAGAFTEALAALHDVDDSVGRVHALRGRGIAYAQSGRRAEAAEALGEALQTAARIRNPLLQARCLVALADLALAGGDWRPARAHLYQALEHLRAVNVPPDKEHVLALLAKVEAMAAG